MISEYKLISIFCEIDDFCESFQQSMAKTSLTSCKKRRGPACCLSLSEIMTIQILFQITGARNFKSFYCNFVTLYWKKYFSKLPGYQRFVELMNRSFLPLTAFINYKAGDKTGIYYVDSSCLPVCHIKRSKRHKTFNGIADYGKTSVGWFFGLKIHLVINHHGEIVAFKVTSGSRNDGKSSASLLKKLLGLVFGDKGYISKVLSEELLANGLKLITRKRKNMKTW